MSTLRQAIKRALPSSVLSRVKRYRARRRYEKEYADLSTQQIFAKIYSEGAWGEPGTLFSGTGSHVEMLVRPYVESAQHALSRIATSEGHQPDAVDLGCGDFAVGSQLRRLCRAYIGCDIVEQVIIANREKHRDVEFRVLDITIDDPPAADVVFIRQVLQHLSNAQIRKVLPKLTRYSHIILTKHLPGSAFTPNLDKRAGPHIRLQQNSGVVLTEPPFNLKVQSNICLCEVVRESDRSVLRTNLYRL